MMNWLAQPAVWRKAVPRDLSLCLYMCLLVFLTWTHTVTWASNRKCLHISLPSRKEMNSKSNKSPWKTLFLLGKLFFPPYFGLSLYFPTSSTFDCPFWLSGHYWVTGSTLDQSQARGLGFLRMNQASFLGLGVGYGTTQYKVGVSWQGKRRKGFGWAMRRVGHIFICIIFVYLISVYNSDIKQENSEIIRRNTTLTLSY